MQPKFSRYCSELTIDRPVLFAFQTESEVQVESPFFLYLITSISVKKKVI